MLRMLPARGVSKSKLHRIARARTCDTSEVAETNRDSNREISSSIPEEQGKEERERRRRRWRWWFHPRVRVWSPDLLSRPIPYCAGRAGPLAILPLSRELNIINLSVRTRGDQKKRVDRKMEVRAHL